MAFSRESRSRSASPSRLALAVTRRLGVSAFLLGPLRLGVYPVPAAAQLPPADPVPAERLAARAWFREARLGLFIHWGVYSQLGQGEWVMQNRGIPVGPYEWLAATFNPAQFEARAWVAIAKAAGARYITITARHHDGFSMFASDATRYDIVDWTPFGRDPLQELAAECRRAGIKLFFYYSQLDWHHPDYFPRGRTGRATGRPERGDWTAYLDFMDAQLEELLTRYGPLGGIWFDGMWDKPDADWRLARTYDLIHRRQPAALVVPNHHLAPLPGEDVQTFEQDLPGSNTAGFNTTEIGVLPLETSLTMNGSWGFNIADTAFKSTRELVGYLVRAAGADANLLLNVGPRPDGTIQPDAVERLRGLGTWLETYGRSIYGTRGGPIPPRSWGVTTQRGDTVFVHVLDWPDRSLALPPLDVHVRGARMLARGTAVPVSQTEAGLTLTMPPPTPDEPDRVVVLETRPRPTRRAP
ncbi:MAG TPA: alpha-L-fucosidase [Gemmatimonadales bacterium]